jgi:hypothetical protein
MRSTTAAIEARNSNLGVGRPFPHKTTAHERLTLRKSGPILPHIEKTAVADHFCASFIRKRS